jgi:uncharacterized protein YegP (UPF0339 family)
MKWEFYKDRRGEWRWRKRAGNNKIVGASSEGFKNRVDCIRNARMSGYEPDIEEEAVVTHEEIKPGLFARILSQIKKWVGRP